MSTTQYTIRGVPTRVDARLRRLARLRGQSLNQVVLEQLIHSSSTSVRAVAHSKKPKINTDFDDLFGSMTPLESEVEAALHSQRVVSLKDWQ